MRRRKPTSNETSAGDCGRQADEPEQPRGAGERERFQSDVTGEQPAVEGRFHLWRRGPATWIGRVLLVDGLLVLVSSLMVFGIGEYREEERFARAERLEERRLADATRLENLRFVRTTANTPDALLSFVGLDLNGSQMGGLSFTCNGPLTHPKWTPFPYSPDEICADFTDAQLEGADLQQINLSDVRLHRAHLSDADMTGANLSGADLSFANLSGADLGGSFLYGADLVSADLSGADLTFADFGNAVLIAADLNGAVLGASESSARFDGADLRCTILDPNFRLSPYPESPAARLACMSDLRMAES